MSASSSDQRYLPRWEVNNRISYKLDESAPPKESLTKDISCSGICIYTDENLLPDQEVRLTLHLSEKASVTVKGKVVWLKMAANGQHEVGINFSETSQEDQETILEHAFELDRSALAKHWFKEWKE